MRFLKDRNPSHGLHESLSVESAKNVVREWTNLPVFSAGWLENSSGARHWRLKKDEALAWRPRQSVMMLQWL